MRRSLALFIGFYAVTLAGQSSSDLTFTLAAKGGRTMFRMGEPIVLEFRFSSSMPGRYEVHAFSDTDKNHFFSEPSDGSIDPLADFPLAAVVAGGRPPGFFPLNGTLRSWNVK